MKNIWREIVQIIFLDLKVHRDQTYKPPKTSRDHKSKKLYRFKPPKLQGTFTTKTFKDEECMKNKKFLTSS